MPHFENDLFCAVWVSANDKGGDLKRDLGLHARRGITKSDICEEIRHQYSSFCNFETDLCIYERLENFFDVNIAVLDRLAKKSVTFKYKPKIWINVKFFRQYKYNTKIRTLYLKPNLMDIFPIMAKHDNIINMPITEICKIMKKTPLNIPFCDENRELWEDHLKLTITIFDLGKDGKINICKNKLTPLADRYAEGEFFLIINDRKLMATRRAKFLFMVNDKLIFNEIVCKTPGCFYRDAVVQKVKRHERTCTKEKIIKTRQNIFGNPENMLEVGVRLGYLPPEAVKFRQKFLVTFDIECLETEYDGDRVGRATSIDKYQKLVSLAVGTNIPGIEPIFFCRKSSEPHTEQEVIDQFIGHLNMLHDLYLAELPNFIQTALDRLDEDTEKVGKFRKTTCQLYKLRTFLRKMLKLRIYGFNAGKFN